VALATFANEADPACISLKQAERRRRDRHLPRERGERDHEPREQGDEPGAIASRYMEIQVDVVSRYFLTSNPSRMHEANARRATTACISGDMAELGRP